MTQTTFNCGAYKIISYGGTAYTITKAHQTIWMRGEEAAQIREDSADFTNPSALDDYFLNFFAS